MNFGWCDLFWGRLLGAFLTSWMLMLLLTQYFISWLKRERIGQVIRIEECPPLAQLHAAKRATPTMGGVLIAATVATSATLWMKQSLPTYHPIAPYWILLFGSLPLFAIGALDDWIKIRLGSSAGLAPRYKLMAQCMVPCIILTAAYLVPSVIPHLSFSSDHLSWNSRVPIVGSVNFAQFFGLDRGLLASSSLLASMLWLVICCSIWSWIISGTSNAVNLTDGLDGLATGLAIMCGGVFITVAIADRTHLLSVGSESVYIEEVAMYLAALLGSLTGFLKYNMKPAKLFMGDAGSLGIGGALALSALLMGRELLLPIAGGVFVVETLSVILQVASFKLTGRRIFRCAPIHHHFEYGGMKEASVTRRFWLAGALCALAAITLR